MTVIGGVSGEEPTEGLQSPKLSKYEAWHTSELNLIVCAWSNNLGSKVVLDFFLFSFFSGNDFLQQTHSAHNTEH